MFTFNLKYLIIIDYYLNMNTFNILSRVKYWHEVTEQNTNVSWGLYWGTFRWWWRSPVGVVKVTSPVAQVIYLRQQKGTKHGSESFVLEEQRNTKANPTYSSIYTETRFIIVQFEVQFSLRSWSSSWRWSGFGPAWWHSAYSSVLVWLWTVSWTRSRIMVWTWSSLNPDGSRRRMCQTRKAARRRAAPSRTVNWPWWVTRRTEGRNASWWTVGTGTSVSYRKTNSSVFTARRGTERPAERRQKAGRESTSPRCWRWRRNRRTRRATTVSWLLMISSWLWCHVVCFCKKRQMKRFNLINRSGKWIAILRDNQMIVRR